MDLAGLLFDASTHYIDHLAPFCALLNCPLVVYDPVVEELAARYYPQLQILRAPNPVGIGEWLSERFSRIVSCWPTAILRNALGPFSFKPLWLPHGNSDKGQILPYFEALQEESAILVYGQKMADFMRSGNLPSERIAKVGAFRKLYYERERSFYDALDLGVSFSDPTLPMVLYAPTWDDVEKNSSFWQAFQILSETLPSSINLLVKPHPNTICLDAPRIEMLIGKHSRGNLQFLLDFPPIYPLLARTSALLGDRSSIGYDYLHFNRPMLFLDPHDSPKGRDLVACGVPVRPEEVFQRDWHENSAKLSQERSKMASYTFEKLTLEDLRANLLKI